MAVFQEKLVQPDASDRLRRCEGAGQDVARRAARSMKAHSVVPDLVGNVRSMKKFGFVVLDGGGGQS